jgi:hypothetical protein
MPPREKRKIPKRPAGLMITPPTPRPAGDDPSLQLFREAKAAQEREATSHHPPATTHYPPATSHAIAPTRDFSRVANSIVREAMPAGLFKGESKKTYDALYLRTRGAIVPRRAVRATQADLMDWAGVSHNTLKAHLKHLTRTGLLKIHYVRGDNTGAEYEPILPEELGPTTHHPPPSQGPTTNQNLAPPTTKNLVLGGGSQIAEASMVYGESKTSFKTNAERSDDDEAFAALARELKAAVKEITGKDPAASEADRWREVAEVLTTELRIAASRTTVSSVPSFLAEHLRRRLFKKDKRQLQQEEAQAPQAPQLPASVDVKTCPDCRGTMYFYPDGFEKGVVRCGHDKLRSGQPTQN